MVSLSVNEGESGGASPLAEAGAEDEPESAVDAVVAAAAAAGAALSSNGVAEDGTGKQKVLIFWISLFEKDSEMAFILAASTTLSSKWSFL